MVRSACEQTHMDSSTTDWVAQVQAHLIPQHARLANGGEQEVVRQKIQAPRRHMLLRTHARIAIALQCHCGITDTSLYIWVRQISAIMPIALLPMPFVVPQAGHDTPKSSTLMTF